MQTISSRKTPIEGELDNGDQLMILASGRSAALGINPNNNASINTLAN